MVGTGVNGGFCGGRVGIVSGGKVGCCVGAGVGSSAGRTGTVVNGFTPSVSIEDNTAEERKSGGKNANIRWL